MHCRVDPPMPIDRGGVSLRLAQFRLVDLKGRRINDLAAGTRLNTWAKKAVPVRHCIMPSSIYFDRLIDHFIARPPTIEKKSLILMFGLDLPCLPAALDAKQPAAADQPEGFQGHLGQLARLDVRGDLKLKLLLYVTDLRPVRINSINTRYNGDRPSRARKSEN